MAERVDLFRFVEANSGLIWTLTNSDISQTYDAGDGAEDYLPTAMGRGTIEQRQEISKANINITIDATHELAIRLLSIIPENQLFLTVFTDDGTTVGVSWKGRLQSVVPGDPSITMTFESIFTSLRRPGLRARFQKSCRHALYGRGCRLDLEDFATVMSCTDVVNARLTIPDADAAADGFYNGGMVRFSDGSLSYIVRHVGENVFIQRVSSGLLAAIAGGDPFDVTMYPGCAHNRTDCNTKFDNLLNYGGFDWIPTKNPMGGSSIV